MGRGDLLLLGFAPPQQASFPLMLWSLDRTLLFDYVTGLRPGEDNSNQWMGVTVASQRSYLGRALVSD